MTSKRNTLLVCLILVGFAATACGRAAIESAKPSSVKAWLVPHDTSSPEVRLELNDHQRQAIAQCVATSERVSIDDVAKLVSELGRFRVVIEGANGEQNWDVQSSINAHMGGESFQNKCLYSLLEEVVLRP